MFITGEVGMSGKAKKIILVLMILFILLMPNVSRAGNICFDNSGFYCAHFSDLDTEWLFMSHTDIFTDTKKVILMKFENGSDRLWKRHGKKGIWGGKRIILIIGCSSDKKDEFNENLVFWSKDVFKSQVGIKLQFFGAIGAIGAGRFGGPPSMRKGEQFDKAKKELENMRIEVMSRFDSETTAIKKWSIRSKVGGNKTMQISSSIPPDILRKIVNGKYQRLALKGNFISMEKAAIFDLRKSSPAMGKLLDVCSHLKGN